MSAGQILTNAGIVIQSNSSAWIEYRPNTNNLTTSLTSLFGSTNQGLNLSNNLVYGLWQVSTQASSASLLNSGAPINPSGVNYSTTPTIPATYDIVWSGTNLYTNGVLCATGAGQPTNNFIFNTLGSTNPWSANGCIKYAALWPNTLIGLAGATNLYNWGLTNGVTNVTYGLIGWYRFLEGTGTNEMDYSGNTNNLVIRPSGGLWASGIGGGGYYFNGTNGWSATNSTFMDNLTNFAVSFWASGHSFSSYPTGALTGTGTFLSKAHVVQPYDYNGFGPGDYAPGAIGWYVGDDNGSDCFGGMYDSPHGFSEGPRPEINQSNGQFHHIVVNFINTSSSQSDAMYLDGAFFSYGAVGSFPLGTSLSNTNMFMIGMDPYGQGIGTTLISAVRCYNRLLTPKEIEILYRLKE